MKNKFSLISMIVILVLAFGSCKKKGCTDETATNYSSKAKKDDGSCVYPTPIPKNPPTITMIGEDSISILIGETYTDAGATAVDHDGNTVEVTVVNTVNTSEVGNYTVVYTATDANGTTNKTRNVSVTIDQSSYIATYDITHDCPLAMPLAASSSIVAGDNTNEFKIEGFLNLVGGECIVEFTGLNLTVPNQQYDLTLGQLDVNGSGTMNNTATAFTISFNFDNNAPFIGETGTCTATYTKQ